MALLTKRMRNRMFEVLVRAGVDASSCDLLDPSGYLALGGGVQQAVIQHRGSSSHFTIWRKEDEEPYNVQSDIGYADWSNEDSLAWETAMHVLANWAQEVAYEAKTPDLWAELQQVPEIVATAESADASNELFTADEQDDIARRLDEVKQLVQERFELADEQMDAINQRLDDAKESSKRLGRKDWLMAFYGAVMSTGLTDAVPPGVIQTALAVVVHGLAHLFGFGGGPPMISA